MWQSYAVIGKRSIWGRRGEDGTWRILERERIDPEYRSPLYTPALAELWRGMR